MDLISPRFRRAFTSTSTVTAYQKNYRGQRQIRTMHGWPLIGTVTALSITVRSYSATSHRSRSRHRAFPPTALTALAEFDKQANGGNGDGRINSQDAIFNSLRLWQDANHNGISEASEIHRLSELGLAEINLDYKESRRRDEHGNWFRYRAKVRDASGAQLGRWAWHVFLVTQ